MKMQTRTTIAGLALLFATSAVQADWFGNNNPWDDDDWPEWTPMYWMDEMFNDDNDYWGGPWGGGPGWGPSWGPSFNQGFSGPRFNPNFGGPRFGGPNFNPNFGPMPAPPAGFYGMPTPYGPPTGAPAPAPAPSGDKPAANQAPTGAPRMLPPT